MKFSAPLLLLLSGASAFAPSSSSGRTSIATITQQKQRQQQVSALQAATIADADLDNLLEVEVEESNAKKTWNDDGFVFGLEGSGLERPQGKTAVVVVEGDTLETQTYQVAIVAATFAAHTYFATSSMAAILEQNGGNMGMTVAQITALTVSSWVAADFGAGVLHWSVDNYGNGRTPVMGGIIAAFQGHHSAPWTITERGFCNNVYKLCTPFGIAPMALISLLTGPSATLFFTIFCALEIGSQEFHKWSHQLKSDNTDYANWLQDAGLVIGRKQHAQHHLAPYDGNYCIVSGFCNEFVDGSGLFRRLEHAVYKLNGVEANSWKLDPELRERTLAGDYSLPDRITKRKL